MRGGLRGELREADDVRQADGHGAELLRRRNLALLQLQEFGCLANDFVTEQGIESMTCLKYLNQIRNQNQDYLSRSIGYYKCKYTGSLLYGPRFWPPKINHIPVQKQQEQSLQ